MKLAIATAAATATAAALWLLLRRRRPASRQIALKDGSTVLVRLAVPGDPSDSATLFRMVEALAEHVGERSHLHNTPKNLARDFAAGKFEALMVETDISTDTESATAIVASAMFYEAYSTWDGRFLFLEDIFVVEEMRGRGVGTMLFKELASLAESRGYRRFQWESLATNAAANKFYSGAVIGEDRKAEILVWRLEASGMRRLR